MTCIVGIIEKKQIVMGADSAGIAGWDLDCRRDRKVFVINGFLMGFTSSFRMGQILRYKFDPPKRPNIKDVFTYLVTDFIDAIRDTYGKAGYLKKDNEREEGGIFLLGYRGRLFKVSSDFQVSENIIPFDSVGCGSSYAKGALYAAPKMLSARQKIRLALQTAETFSAGVRRPFHIEVLKSG